MEESKERDSGGLETPPPLAVPITMALPVQLSPHGTLRVSSNEHFLIRRTNAGGLEAKL